MSGSLIAIVGETASGKSALALYLAERFGGELICADSRTVYQGLDIGTAKPTAEDRTGVPHYCLDIVRPDQQFSVADFKEAANNAIDDITSRGKLPIMVGGTGLYIDAMLYDYQFRAAADPAVRAELNELSVEQLQERLHDLGLPLPENVRNPRHLIRAIETRGQASQRGELRPQTLVLGLQVERGELRRRIEKRVDAMIAAGFVDEARRASDVYGWNCPALQAPGYKDLRAYLEGAETLELARQNIIKNHLGLAKRQRTWFRRNKCIQWLTTEDKLAEAVDITTTFLNK